MRSGRRQPYRGDYQIKPRLDSRAGQLVYVLSLPSFSGLLPYFPQVPMPLTSSHKSHPPERPNFDNNTKPDGPGQKSPMSYYPGSSSFALSFAPSVWQPLQDDNDAAAYDESDSDPPASPTLLSDSDKSASSTTEYHTLYILRFTQPFIGLHWSLHVQAPGESEGPVYDVWYHPDSGTWERKETFAEYVSNETLIWGDGRTAERYIGRNFIGLMDDAEIVAFREVLNGTPLLVGASEDENCQSWVKDVIEIAAGDGLLTEGAVGNMDEVDSF